MYKPLHRLPPPDSLVTEHVRSELCLGLGQARSGGAVVTVDLQQGEVSNSNRLEIVQEVEHRTRKSPW